MNPKRYSQEQVRKNGFYVALAVCLVAVGIAAWSTYDAVNSYLETEETPSAGQTASPAPANPASRTESSSAARPATGGTPGTVSTSPRDDREDPEAAKHSEPTPSAPPQATPAPAQAPVEEPEEPVEPANAPLYTRSDELIFPVGTDTAAKAYSAGAPVYSATMRDWRIHRGADLAAQPGETVVACGNGLVQETYSDAMLGNVVTVEHGDYVFAYCGLGEDLQVRPGDVVTMGQPLGTVTAVPCEAAEAPHLHLEVRRDGATLDPEKVLSRP